MSNEIKLSISTFQIRRKYDKSEDKFMKFENVNFIDLFTEFVSTFDNGYQGVQNDKNVCRLSNDPNFLKFDSKKALIYGFMKTGKTGYKRNIEDIEDPDGETVFIMDPKHIDVTKAFFLFHFPSDSNVGILIIQGVSTSSIATIFRRIVLNFVNSYFGDSTISFSRFVPKSFLEQIKTKGKIESVSLKSYKLSSDIANKQMGTNFERGKVTVTITVKGSISEKLFGVNGKFFSQEFIDQYSDGNETDIEVKYDFNGKSAIARKSNDFEMSPNYYIPLKELEMDPSSNLPTELSIERYCLSFLEHLQNQIYAI